MNFIRKLKCGECKALVKGKTSFTCFLGHTVLYQKSEGIVSAPKPGENCYRPMTEDELTVAKILIRNRKVKNKK